MKNVVYLLLFWVARIGVATGETTVSADLSATTTDLDHPVKLEIRIDGGRSTRPPEVVVNGLTVSFVGTSSRMQMLNLQATASTIFTYLVGATNEGVFQIPPINVDVAGKEYRTAALTLKVVTKTPNRTATTSRPYFGELIIPKDAAFVGEQLPIEMRFYFNQRITFQPYPQGQFPMIDGESFVTKKYAEPSEKQLEADGHFYRVLVYRTALTGVKPGTLSLASATQQFLISAPFSARSGLGDPLEDYQQQVVEIKTNGASLQIKPLPVVGRPASFKGAIGDFTISTTVQPTTTRVGDPITMKVEVRGLGNFDRMEAPSIQTQEGWKIYTPSSETQALDDIGLSATKTFSYAILPEKAVTASPTVEFSYFDPNAERYVVLKSEATRVEVQGEASPKDTIVAPIVTTPGEPKQKPELDVLDILPQPSAQVSFIPLIAQPTFWIAQAVPLSALVFAGLFFWIQQARTANLPVRKWLQQKRLLWHKIDASQSRPEVLDAAVRLLELQLLIRSRGDQVRSLDEAIHAVPDDLRTALNALIETRGLSAYGGIGSDKLSDEERHQIRQNLRRWETAT